MQLKYDSACITLKILFVEIQVHARFVPGRHADVAGHDPGGSFGDENTFDEVLLESSEGNRRTVALAYRRRARETFTGGVVRVDFSTCNTEGQVRDVSIRRQEKGKGQCLSVC